MRQRETRNVRTVWNVNDAGAYSIGPAIWNCEMEAKP